MYSYIVDISYYITGSGYSHTETYDTGECDHIMTADEWYAEAKANDAAIDYPEGWYEVIVSIYEKGADPAFDDPISKTSCNVDNR